MYVCMYVYVYIYIYICIYTCKISKPVVECSISFRPELKDKRTELSLCCYYSETAV